MTEDLERQMSLAALEAQTPEGARELAAAEVMVKASTLMWKAFEQSGMSQRELADALGVSEGRVSQILHGDGNVRISTLARYLRATGYSTHIEAVPADASVKPLRKRVSKRRGRSNTTDPHDIYVAEIEYAGVSAMKVTAVPSGMPLNARETSATNFVGTASTRLELVPTNSGELGT